MVLTGRANVYEQRDLEAGLGAEIAAVKQLYLNGVVRRIRHRGDRAGAVIAVEAVDEQTARAYMEGLPLARAGVVVTDSLIPLKPYSGFGPDA